ncbi:hypothetical protein C8F01DRAFT_1147132 [Mycena amicta]|nr:hypothetical protein C8F01DRAFT_1147132 [Mycena amicta]
MENIPVELLTAIFIEYVSLDSPRVGAGSRLRTGPLLLASVSATWRAIVLAIPALWKTLRIFPPHRPLVKILPLWLSRAGERPLDISVDPAFDSGHLSSIIALLRPSSAWIRKLEIRLTDSVGLPAGWSCERLETLSLVFVADGRPPAGSLEVFRQATRLRSLTLHLGHAGLEWFELLPLRQITTLELFNGTTLFCLRILRQTPLLQTLIVDLVQDPRFHNTLLAPIPLLHLRTLSSSGLASRAFMRYLVVPELRALDIRIAGDNAKFGDAFSGLRELAGRSRWDSLRTLCLKDLEHNFVNSLRRVYLPSVVELQLDWPATSLAQLYVELAGDPKLAADLFKLENIKTLVITNYRVPTASNDMRTLLELVGRPCRKLLPGGAIECVEGITITLELLEVVHDPEKYRNPVEVEQRLVQTINQRGGCSCGGKLRVVMK